MARIEYAPGITPLTKEHSGFTFQSGRAANTMAKAQANDRARDGKQNNKKMFLMHAVQHWRTLTPAVKLAWSNFAATYPQPTKRNPAAFLTGYQNFIKRSAYLFLNYGIETIFDEPPLMETLNVDPVTFSIDQSENCIDCSTAYIHNFGMLPKAGDFLLLRVLPMAIRSGQYFEPIEETIKCTAVYIDGLFLSLHFPNSREDIVYSIFLSKPVNQSVNYTGTKTRYMGCFTSKKFIDLSDTPKTYVGQAGKFPKVKADESGLEFVPAPGGGITCADLPNCQKIISMDANTLSIASSLVLTNLCSVPFINFGRLYNNPALRNGHQITKAGYRVPTKQDWDTLIANCGGNNASPNKLKEMGSIYWTSQFAGVDNAYKFNARGASYRIYSNGLYGVFKNSGDFWSITSQSGSYYWVQLNYNSNSISAGYRNPAYGKSVRLIKENQTFEGPYIGNDGKVYRTCKIFDQIWTCDNLAETLYRDGTVIPIITDNTQWINDTLGASCYVDGNANNI